MPEIALIIPHYNDVARLMRCLAALGPQLAGLRGMGLGSVSGAEPDSGTDSAAGVEVVVVDNGSSESLAPLRAAWPDLRLVTETRKGAACARNRGVAETTAPVLVFLDSDCLPAPDWLATVRHLAAGKLGGLSEDGASEVGPLGAGADLIGGAVIVFDETPPPRNGAQAFEAVFAFDNGTYVASKGFSVTANLITRRNVFEATGPFLPGLSEDLDWCRRARSLGYRLAYAPELQVGHPSRGDWGQLRRKWRRLTDEAYGLQGSTPSARLAWGLKAMAMAISVLVHAPRVLRSPRLQGWGERRAGLAMLARLRFTRLGWMMAQAVGRQTVERQTGGRQE